MAWQQGQVSGKGVRVMELLEQDLIATAFDLNLDEPGGLSTVADLDLETLYAQPQRLSHWQLAHSAAVESWLLDYCPRADAIGLERVRGYWEAFHHCCEVEAWELAWQIAQIPVEPQQKPWHQQLYHWGHCPEQIELYERLLDHLGEAERAVCCGGLARAYRFVGRIEESIAQAQAQLTAATTLQNSALMLEALGSLGDAHRRKSKYKLAEAFHCRQLQLAQAENQSEEQINALLSLASLFCDVAKYEKSVSCLKQAKVLNADLNNPSLENRIISEMGQIYCLWGKYKIALEYFEMEQENRKNLESNGLISKKLKGLSPYYIMMGEYGKAQANLEQELAIAKRVNDKTSACTALNSLGILFGFRLNQPQKALPYFEQALAETTTFGDPHLISIVMANLSGCLGCLQRYEAALDYAQRSLQISRKIGRRQNEAIAVGAIANAHWHSGHPFLGIWIALKMFLIWQPWQDANGQLMLRVFIETVGSKLRFSAQKKAQNC